MNYEYSVEVVYDRNGAADLKRINSILFDKGQSGWRLVAVSTNELGKNAVSVGGFGVNSTVDQTLLYFEREKEKDEIEEKAVELLVDKSNTIDPILPYKISFLKSSNKYQLVVSNKSYGSITGIQARLILYNIFGEKYESDYTYYLNFTKGDRGLLYSEFINHDISDGFITGGLKFDFFVKNYVIDSKEPVNLENVEMTSIYDAIESDRNRKMNEFEGELKYEDFVKALKDTKAALDSFMLYQNASSDQKKSIEVYILSKL